MPYSNIRELPPEIKKALPAGAQRIFMQVVNSVLEGDGNDASAFRQAWAAVERAGYRKGSDGRWHKKELVPAAQKGVQSVTTPGQLVNEFTGKKKEVEEGKKDSGVQPVAVVEPRRASFAGAVSFAEYDDYKEASDSLQKVDNQVWIFRCLIDNIFEDEYMTAPEKATAIEIAAADLKGRVANPPDIKADVRKTEGGAKFPAADYAYVPDATSPSTWKLRLAESPGKVTVAQVARAITAMQPGGFRGNVVQIPSGDKPGVIRKISAAIGKISGADDTQIANLRERLSAVKEDKSFDVEEFWKALDIEQDIGNLPEQTEEVQEFEEINDESAEEDEKAGRRLKKGWLSRLKELAKTLGDVLAWAEYKDEATITKRLLGSGFKVYKSRDGKLRWLGFSSNAFKDRHQEIFSTKSLRDAVKRADKSGERGPLLLFHISEANIGSCDFQAMEGRFLVESGTFNGNKLGKKAAQYFDEHQDGDFGLSVGYEYKADDREDKIYDWMNVLERSVTPAGKQANTWCEFATVATGGKQLDKDKLAFLTDVFGEDTANEIVEKAASQSKELEKTVDFKAAGEEEEEKPAEDEKAKKASDHLSTLKMLIGKVGDASLKKQLKDALNGLSGNLKLDAGEAKGSKDEESDEKEETEGTEESPAQAEDAGADALKHIVGLIGDVTTKVGQMGEAITKMQADVKELQKSEDEKISEKISPRARVAKKADEGEDGHEEDSEAVKAVKTGLDGDEAGNHPAAGHMSDLTRLLGGVRQ